LREINPPIQIINLFNSGQHKKAVKLACKMVALIPLINERMENLKETIWLTVEEVKKKESEFNINQNFFKNKIRTKLGRSEFYRKEKSEFWFLF